MKLTQAHSFRPEDFDSLPEEKLPPEARIAPQPISEEEDAAMIRAIHEA